jgi:hypothetical protein
MTSSGQWLNNLPHELDNDDFYTDNSGDITNNSTGDNPNIHEIRNYAKHRWTPTLKIFLTTDPFVS